MGDAIINTYDQMTAYGGHRVAICYRARGSWRGGESSAWQVLHIVNGVRQSTDLSAPWYNNELKTFLLFDPRGGTPQERRCRALAQAMAWCAKHYGSRTFLRNRLGDMVEAVVQAKYPIQRRKKGVV